MIAYISLAVLFVLPAIDLSLRMLGLAGWLVAGVEVCLILGVAAGLYRRSWFEWPRIRTVAAVFVAFSLFVLSWYVLRGTTFAFSQFGENIYDLHYIASLYAAERWPPPDLWNPGEVVDRYYFLGFYSVAYYARLFGLDVGRAYVLFVVLIPAIVFLNYWLVVQGGAIARTTAALAATFPSTGVSLLVTSRLIDSPSYLRAMGHVRVTEWVDRKDGSWTDTFIDGRAYPIEGFSHLLGFLGDLHPPVFTLLLLALLVAAMYASSDKRDIGFAAAAVGASVPLSYLINPWTLPCFAALALYVVLQERTRRSLGLVVGGVAVATVVLWPILAQSHLATGSVELGWLSPDFRSRPLIFLAFWGPLLVGSMLAIRREGRWLLLSAFLCMVIGLEVLLLDDPYGGAYERFNGVLKVGSFALAGATAVILIELSHRANKIRFWCMAVIFASLALMQLHDVLRYRQPDEFWSRNWTLSPQRMIPEAESRGLYGALRHECPGLTLERQTEQAYSMVPLISTLLAWPTVSGWHAHLAQIGALTEDRRRELEALQRWYAEGDPSLVNVEPIDYVLVGAAVGWNEAELERRRVQMAPDYEFVRTNADGQHPVVGYFHRLRRAPEACGVSGGPSSQDS